MNLKIAVPTELPLANTTVKLTGPVESLAVVAQVMVVSDTTVAKLVIAPN